MRKIIPITIVLLILIFASCQKKNSNILDGKTFIGFEEDIYFDSPKETFQTILTFKNDSVLVIRNSILIIEKDTLNFKKSEYSYQYKGVVKKEKTNLEFVAYAYKCEDCGVLAEVDEKGNIKDVLEQKVYKGIITKNGLNLNGINFKPE
ncbi:hypothetical protein [Flavobacterium eburneipallidum]|uniref:hypothetical protein n=1 Tax=Flavobacterium eburneipallidum TaxID=3003263 RepID=UPI0022AC1CE7|nr:hypothetical protein [Flavobacterium eburneipallidum]